MEKKKLGDNEKKARKNVLTDLSKQLEASIRQDIKKPASPKAGKSEEVEAAEGNLDSEYKNQAEEETTGQYSPEPEPEFNTEEDIDAQIQKLMAKKAGLKKSDE